MRVHLRFLKKDPDLCKWRHSVSGKMLSFYLNSILSAELHNRIAFIPQTVLLSMDESPCDISFHTSSREIEAFVASIPSTLVPATTFTQAQSILTEIEADTDTIPVVKLTGFGADGLDIGKVGGGLTFGKGLGGTGGYQALKSWCDEQRIPLFVDFDLVRYRKSGLGFSARYDGAYNANNVTARQHRYSVATLAVDTTTYDFMHLKRGLLPTAAEKLLEKAESIGIGGISLSSLSHIAYSDYAATDAYVKSGMAQDVATIFQTVRDGGHSLLAEAANVYAATNADYLMGTPTWSSQYEGLDVEVPFYQMVFKGHIPLAVSSVNLAYLPQKQFLKAVESGSALAFTLSAETDAAFVRTHYSALLASLYSDQKETIAMMTERTRAYYERIEGATIINHEILAPQVSRTTFSNGTTVTVNFSDSPYQTADGQTIPAEDFSYTAG